MNDKSKVLAQIIKMLRCDAATSADLSLIKSGSSKGAMNANKNKIGESNIKIINQSVTGLFENKERV